MLVAIMMLALAAPNPRNLDPPRKAYQQCLKAFEATSIAAKMDAAAYGAAVKAACQKMLSENAGQRMDNAQAQGDWALCRDQQLPFFQRPADPNLALWRLSVAQTAPAFDDLPWPQLVEWHGGLRWLWAPVDAGAQLHALAHAHGGNAIFFVASKSAFSGATGQFFINESAQMAIHQRLKRSLDPHGIFNPHRMFPAW